MWEAVLMSFEVLCHVRRTMIVALRQRLSFGAQETADFIQYRPESEWAGREFVVTHVPRDREWFDGKLPSMFLFWNTCREMSARPDKREVLVRKRSAPVKVERGDALAARALARCQIDMVAAMLAYDPEPDESGMGQDEVRKILKTEPVVCEEGEPLTVRVLDGGPEQGPQLVLPLEAQPS